MKGILMVVLIFLVMGMVALVTSIIVYAPLAIIAFELGYLILVSAVGIMSWKKYCQP